MGDDLDEQLSPTFPDDRPLSPSDDSDVYSHVDLYNQENGEHLVKPSHIKNRRKLHQGTVSVNNFFKYFFINLTIFFSAFDDINIFIILISA